MGSESDYGSMLDHDTAVAAPAAALVDQATQSALGAPPTVAPGPGYDQLLDSDKSIQRDSLKQSVYAAQDLQPDRHAKVMALASDMKLPVPIVERNYEDLAKKKQLADTDYEKLIDENPRFSGWLEDPNNAAVAKHDMPALKSLEDQVNDHEFSKTFLNTVGAALSGFGVKLAALPGLAYDAATLPVNEEAQRNADLANRFGLNPKDIAENDSGSTDAMGRPVFNTGNTQQLKTPEAISQNFAYTAAKFAKEQYTKELPQLGYPVFTDIKNMNFHRAAIGGLVQIGSSAPDILGALALGIMVHPTLGAAFFGAGASAETSAELRDQGIDPATGTSVALIHGVIAAGAGELTLLSPFRAWDHAITNMYGKQVSRALFQDMFKTLTGTVMHQGSVGASMSLADDMTDYVTGVNPNALEGMWERAGNAGAVTAGTGLVLVAPAGIGAGIARQQQIHHTNSVRDFYLSFGATAEATKLRQNLPDAQRGLVEQITKDTPVENIFISPDKIDSYFQSKNINPVAAMGELGVLPEYGAAKDNGNDIKIPLSTWVDKFVGTEHYNALADDIKFSPESLSTNEQKVETERLKAEAEKNKASEPEKDSGAQVYDTVAEQLKSLGLDEKHAELYESAFKNLGERMGVDPKELFDQFNLRISGEEPTEGGKTLNQEELTPEKIKAEVHEAFNGPDAVENYAKIPGTKNGSHLDVDLARNLYHRYAESKEGAIRHADDTYLEASKFIKRLFNERMGMPRTSPTDYVHILGGGSASGKTTYLDTFKDVIHAAHTFVDTTSSSYEKGKEQIEKALANGLFVHKTFTFRDFEKALEGNASRFKKTGRLVEPDFMAHSHVAALDAFLRLEQEYRNDPRVHFEAFENNKEGEPPNRMSIAQLAKLRYNDNAEGTAKDRLLKLANERLKDEVAQVRAAKEARSGAGSQGLSGQNERSAGESGREAGQLDGSIPTGGKDSGTKTLKQSALPAVPLPQVAPNISPIGFYSQLENEVQKMDFKSIPAKDLASRIKNISGLKKEEIEFTGLDEYLKLKEQEPNQNVWHVTIKDQDGKTVHERSFPTKEAADEEAQYNTDKPGLNLKSEVKEGPKGTGKVSKEEITQFLKDNGVKVEQVVLSEDFAGGDEEAFNAADLSWQEPSRDDADSSDYQSEYEYYSSNDFWDEERRSELRNELAPDHMDEGGHVDEDSLSEAMASEIEKRSEKYSAESVESDDYSNARFTAEEANTGWTLNGNDESGWYSPETGEHFQTNLNEAKVQLLQHMIAWGAVSGSVSDFIKPEDIEWGRGRGVLPTDKTITKKAKIHLAENKDRIMAEVKKEWAGIYDTPAEQKTEFPRLALQEAESEVKEKYHDHTNKKNTVEFNIEHPFIKGEIVGNDVRGYEFTVYYEKTRRSSSRGIRFEQPLEAKTIEAAKSEAIKLLQEKNLISDPSKKDEGSGTQLDVNEPRGKTKYNSYVVPGAENYREILLTLPRDGESYKSGHFGESNILAHVRISDRVDGEGRKTLFIEELQSDWHQQGREGGYKSEEITKKIAEVEEKIDNLKEAPNFQDWMKENHPEVSEKTVKKYFDEQKGEKYDAWAKIHDEYYTKKDELRNERSALKNAVPDAPFKNTDAWAQLALKRMIRLAVEQGYESLAWSPAHIHVERWGTDSVSWVKKAPAASDFKVAVQGGIIGIENSSGRLISDPKGSGTLHFTSEEAAHNYIQKEKLLEPHWLVGSAEQRGGNVDGMNIEETARRRGELLERKGERVTTKEELKDVIASTLGRERNDRSLEALTDRVWKRMQGEDEHTGAILPRAEGMQFFYDKVIPDVAKKLIKKIDPEAKIEVGHIGNEGEEGPRLEALEIPITEKMKAEVHKGFTLFQHADEGKPRGQINIGPDGMNIQILKDADRSTFLHETGHFYLEVLNHLAKDESAPQQIKDDLDTVRKWVGNEGEPFTAPQHEQFARGFESYLMEGKAPSEGLRKAFAAFKVWLTNVYRSLKNLNVELSPEVRGVFDRILATDFEIAKAQEKQHFDPLFKEPAIYGLSDDDFAKYQSAIDAAKQAADDELRARIMKDVTKEETALYKEQRQKIQSRIEAEANQTRVFRARSLLQSDALPDGSPRPEGTEKIKIDRKSLVDQFGEEILKKLPRMYSRDGGMDVGLVADLLGYETSDQMIQELGNSIPKDEWVAKQTDAQMKDLNPDLLSSSTLPDEAMAAIHNDAHASVLRMEFGMMAKSNLPALKGMIKSAAKKLAPDEQIKENAANVVGAQNVRELSPNQFEVAERKHRREAAEKLTQGDFDGFFESKRLELYNHELYRAASDAREDVNKSLKLFKKMAITDEKASKSRDVDLVATAKAILSAFGIGKTDESPAIILERIKRYDPEGYSAAHALVEMATAAGSGNYNEISYNRFSDMRDAVKGIWDLAKSAKEIEIDGIKYEKAKVIADLSTIITDLNPNTGPAPGYTKALTFFDKTKSVLLSAKAMLRRTEHWVTAMDGGDKGPFRTNIWNPVVDAATKFRLAKHELTQHYLNNVVQPAKEIFDRKPIQAPEIGYTFQSKSELLGALLHTGNESNLRKLLRGRDWGSVDESNKIDTTQWDKFIFRMQKEGMLTKADYDYVQGVWDMYEKTKPDAQRAHKKLYGYYFNEITEKPFSTPFGDYRGGYAPAIIDPNLTEDAAIRQERDALEQVGNSYMFPTAGRGFTQSRIETYAAPLALDLGYISLQIDKVLRFAHLEPAVREVSKIVMDKGFRQTLASLDSSVASEMLVPWLQRSVTQQTSSPSGTGKAWKAADYAFRRIRSNTGLNAMALNVVNTFHQTTGFSVAATKVEPHYLRDALWSYLKDAKGTHEAMEEKSDYMKAKGLQISDLQGEVNDLILHPTKFEKAGEFVKKNGYILQRLTQGAIETVAWKGAYNKGVEQGYSDPEAIRYADSVVRQTQHSMLPEDISRFGTGTPFARLFSMYFDYYNMKANLMTTEIGNMIRESGIKKTMPSLIGLYAAGMMIPAIMSQSFYHLAGGALDENDDHKYMDDVMKIFFLGQANEMLALAPVVGPLINNQVNRFNDNRYDDRLQLSPAIENLQKAWGAPSEIYNAIEKNGKKSAAIRDAFSLLGMMTGLPLQPLAKPLGYLTDLNDHKNKPATGPIDFTRGLVSGQGHRNK